MNDRLLEELKVYEVRVTMQSETEVELPEWLGSTIRGALGTELLKRCCLRKKPACDRCTLVDGCSGYIMFGTASVSDAEMKSNPYVIRNYEQYSNRICFDLLLFGNGCEMLRDLWIILRAGLRLGVARKRLDLISIVDKENGRELVGDDEIGLPERTYYSSRTASDKAYTLRFRTPFVCKREAENVDFDYLFRAAFRKVKGICDQNGIECGLVAKDLFPMAKQVGFRKRDIHTVELKRYSNRTDSTLSKVGILGEITFWDVPQELFSVLIWAEHFGIGKFCVMGLGQFDILE